MNRRPRNGLHGVVLALSLASAASVVRATDLGRLFLRPAERAELQQRRQALHAGAPAEPRPVLDPAPASPTAAPVVVNGVVQRKGGRSTVWVNGTNDYDGDPARLPATVRVLPGGRVRIGIDQQNEIELRPGQVYDPAGDTVHDRFAAPDAAP
jgi:hypothetical protein